MNCFQTSFFTDTSRLGDVFSAFGTSTFQSTVTSWYSVSIPTAFDGTTPYLFGTPAYKVFKPEFQSRLKSIFPFLGDIGGEFPTLRMTYERFSSDLTYDDVERIHEPWINTYTQTECLGGVCYKALTTEVLKVMQADADNRTLFEELGWYSSDGINLLRGILGLQSSINPSFFSRYLYGMYNPSLYSGSMTSSTQCTYRDTSDTCSAIKGYGLSETTDCTATLSVSPAACCELCTTCAQYFFDGTTCYTCSSPQPVELNSIGTIGVRNTYFNTTSTVVLSSECMDLCYASQVTTHLYPPYEHLDCGCWEFSGSTCTMYYGTGLYLSAGTLLSGLAQYRAPLGSAVRDVG